MLTLRCLLVGHDVVLERYGADGRRLKNSLAWRCVRCMKIVGRSTIKPSPKLLRDLRVQAVSLSRRLRAVAGPRRVA